MKYISNSPIQTKDFARKIAASLLGGETLCLTGDLGSGKTTFTIGLIDFFLPGKRVLSPTFIIVRHYLLDRPLIKNIYHLDLYRLLKSKDVVKLGLLEFINKSDTIVAIEWAEKLGRLPLKKRIDINFSIINDKQRLIKVGE